MSVTAKPTLFRFQDYYDEMHKTGPDTLNGRYLRQFWHPIRRSVDLKPGQALTVKLLSEEFTLYRGDTGTLHLTENRCPHRQVKLGVGFVEGDSIRCMYHGWKFAADGACEERPAEHNCGNIAIKTYPVAEFVGLIYAYIGGGEAPAFPPYPGFEGEGIVEAVCDHFACNYLQSYENDWDIYHANWTHITGEIHGPEDRPTRFALYNNFMNSEKWTETDYGVTRDISPGGDIVNTTIQFFPATARLLIPTYNEIARRSGGPHFRQTFMIHSPIDDVSHYVFATQLVPLTGADAIEYQKIRAEIDALEGTLPKNNEEAMSILAGKKFLKDCKAHPMLVGIEDQLTQVSQGEIVNRHTEKLGRSDQGVILLRRILARELHALATTGKTTQWRRLVETSDLPPGMTVMTF